MIQKAALSIAPTLQAFWLPALTQTRSRRRYGSAWSISCFAHGLLIAVGFWGGTHVLEAPRPPIRLVFVEPPPPPPAPMTAPVAAETALPVERPPSGEKKPQPQPQPKRQKPERPKIVQTTRAHVPPKHLPPEPLTPPQPATVAEPTPPTEATAVESVSAARTTNADNTGVVGGVAGGHSGGVIGGRGTEPFPVDQVASPPLLVSRVTPDYPRPARLRGVEGLVLLEAILDREGRIEEEVKVLQSVPLLDEAAIAAVRRWQFRPARDHDNQPVRVILEVPIRFVLR